MKTIKAHPKRIECKSFAIDELSGQQLQAIKLAGCKKKLPNSLKIEELRKEATKKNHEEEPRRRVKMHINRMAAIRANTSDESENRGT